jgi:TRAP-type mannitol/chloroaromatic compound transport system substrate-binding protein
LLVLLPSADTYAQKRVKWKVQSAFPTALDVIGESGPRFSDHLKMMSDGTLELRFFEPGALVPALEIFNAVSAGSVDAGWTTPGYHAGQIPAAPFFTGVPFGPAAGEYLAWLNFGGGHELKDEIYARHGVKGITCILIPPEASGWFRERIDTVDDLKGIKMRFFGLGAKVMQKLGVSTQLLAPGDIYPAMERGVIDATEFSFPSLDYQLGFYQIAKHYYFPGWQNQSALGELIVNLAKYNALSDIHRRMIEVACEANITWTFAASEARQFVAMRKLVDDHGVTVHFWSDEVLEKMRESWQEVVTEESASDSDFKRAYASYSEFRKRYAIWWEHGYLK